MRVRIICLIVLFLLPSTTPVTADWSHNPTVNNPVCTTTTDQFSPEVVSDGQGGAILAWSEGSPDIRVEIRFQRIDAEGTLLWPTDGVPVGGVLMDGFGSIYQVADGAGGAIVAWTDDRSGDHVVYAQRVDAGGNICWPAGGIAVSDGSGEQVCSDIAADGAGGAIISWRDYRWLNYDVRVQRVDAAGNLVWAGDGVMACVEPSSQMGSRVMGNGSGGATVIWNDYRNGADVDLYAQRVDAGGNVQWAPDGVIVVSAAGDQRSAGLAGDGSGGAIVTWEDLRSVDADIYAQRIDIDGATLWPAGGVIVCAEADDQLAPRLVSDGFGGAVIIWDDWRWLNLDIRGQRIDADGTLLWEADGLMICVEPSSQILRCPLLATDDGGTVVTWSDVRTSSNSRDVYAQRVSGGGYVQWQPDGIPVCTLPEVQQVDGIVPDGSGGVIIGWNDNRSGDNYDIYAQQVDLDGLLGGPVPPPQMVAGSLTCSPGAGTVPFTTWMTLSLENLNTSYIRRVAGHIDVFLASGTGMFPNWRTGFTNIDPDGSYDASWPVNIPALGSMIGANRFELHAMDVTPQPYNIFPFPPSGSTDSDTCVVYGIAP